MLEFFESDRLLVEEFLADLFVDIRDGVDEFVVGLFAKRDEVAFEFFNRVSRAVFVVVRKIDRLLIDHIDLTDELIFATDRNEDADGVGSEFFLHLAEDVVEVGAGAVHLVDEHDARHVVLGRLAPDGFGLRLDTGDSAEDHDCAV